ncbi:hypothetical protein F511_34145 [Dorcoceras hygrometricum]|uniref:Dystroglycan-like n=1 Tax=Dorcoceras hygrometricum TaxID=472368 RepID=A0A2Z7B404_9LAMI|nr:hypothetical protein F511_34145 [Dorcoceras hygrometricum]
MLLSRSADTDLCFSVFLLWIAKRQRFDKLERRRGVHCFVSADEVFSRYFVEEVQQLLSLFVEDCDTTAFGLVGTTAFCLIQQKRSFDKPADALLGVYQQMNQQMEKRVCISADEFFQAFFQSKFLTTMMDVSADVQNNERNVEKSKDKSKDKYKERSSDRKMKTNNNKRFSRKHDRKVLVAEESTKSWADSDSDTSSSSSSSSESEQEEVHCFMADQTDEDEVFDFSNVEFTRDDLVIALNDMVKEYRKLSHSFEEAKAENMSLKSSSAESSSDEQEDADILKTELSKLQAENELLRNAISELKAEVAKSTVEMSSYNKANITLQKLCENQKQASDKTGIGFNDSEFCEGESILGMDDPGMVSMFEALVASGLRGFLGCPAIVYEDVLVDFFEKASVRSGVVISTVGGQLVEISEKLFAETFELPVDGLGDLSEIPKDVVFDARSIVSQSGEPINLSGRKNQMKMPFRLLCDIVAKAISVKAGSFNAITVEKFSLLAAVFCGVKMNWAKFLFGVLKKMVSASSKQAKGFAIQISVLLANFSFCGVGDGAEEVTGAVKQKAVSKKRSAADVSAAVPKKRRSIKKKSVSFFSTLEMVAVADEAVPLQQVEEPLDVEEPRCSSADAVDLIIQQVLDETRAADAPADIAQPAVTEEKNCFDLPYDDLVQQWEAERPVVTASDTEDEDIATVDVAPADEVQQVQDFEAPISAEDVLSADEEMSLDDILLSIPVDIPLPSTCMEVTKIKMGQMIKIPGVTEKTWFLNSLPHIPADDKGKEILVEKDPVQGNPATEHYSLICADIDLLVSLRAKVIDEVATFFNSFSLKKLASINFEEMYSKEEQVLSWGETESPQEAIQRKFYILLKYRTILV